MYNVAAFDRGGGLAEKEPHRLGSTMLVGVATVGEIGGCANGAPRMEGSLCPGFLGSDRKVAPHDASPHPIVNIAQSDT
jgi:hypothetical protein